MCEESELYYIDFVLGDDSGEIPEQIVNHIESCDYCRRRINDLKTNVLVDDEASSQDKSWKGQMHVLGLHFVHLGKEISCDDIKPFLPTLVEPFFETCISTPITVHLDRCEECSRDLNTIKEMGLSSKQLCTLSSIFTDSSSEHEVDCHTAASFIQKYVDLEFEAIEPEVIKHLCCCSVCQLLIYKARASKIEALHGESISEKSPCDSVMLSDVFDYCFPYDFISSQKSSVGFREPFVKELRQCPDCLQKVQDLHKRMYAIKERPGSGIVTVYKVGQKQELGEISQVKDGYKNFSVEVETVTPEERPRISEIEQNLSSGVSRDRYSVPFGLKNVAKTLAAAAVIAVAFMFLYTLPRASAVSIRQIYNAIQNAANIYTTQYAVEDIEPLQERWISKDLEVLAIKDKSGLVVWNTSDKMRYMILPGSVEPEMSPLSEKQISLTLKKIQSSLNFVPFDDISEVPEGANWYEVEGAELENVPVNTKVYELTWTERTSNKAELHFKWRGFIEEETNKPLRTELYMRRGSSGDYELQMLYMIEYWTESQMEDFLSQALH
jgi:hypothetical protein